MFPVLALLLFSWATQTEFDCVYLSAMMTTIRVSTAPGGTGAWPATTLPKSAAVNVDVAWISGQHAETCPIRRLQPSRRLVRVASVLYRDQVLNLHVGQVTV